MLIALFLVCAAIGFIQWQQERLRRKINEELRALTREALDRYLAKLLEIDRRVSRCYDGVEEDEGCIFPVFAAPPDTQAMIDAAYENAAKECDELAHIMECGAGEDEPGHRLRQAARNIRSRIGKPLEKKP